MTIVPKKIGEHRVKLMRLLVVNREDAAQLERERLGIEGRLDSIDLCIAAIEDAAKTPNAEAVEGEEEVAATPQAPEAESAPAGSVGAVMAFCPIHGTYDFCPPWQSKKARAPRRDILGVVWRYVESNQSSQPENAIEIAAALGLLPREVDKALAYWQDKGRLTLDGGVVRLRTEPVAQADVVTGVVYDWGHQPR